MDNETFPEPDVFLDSIAVLEITNQETGEKQDVFIYPGKEIRIGRDSKCDHAIEDIRVSKQHFRIYSIVYEEGTTTDIPPLIYCEDLESSNGTYINGVLHGIIGRERIGYLLSDGDLIEIRPFWTCQFHQQVYNNIVRTKEELNDLEYFQHKFYITDRVLGKGHYGAVYLAQDPATRKQSACKVVNLGLAAQKLTKHRTYPEEVMDWSLQLRRAREGRQIALREIHILARLDHPHITSLKKAFIMKETLYMFTELAPGGDLFSYLASNGGHLEDWHARVISRQIILAIEFMHTNGITHRDIKPENVLIMQTDCGGRVVLTDFGLANTANGRTGRLNSVVGSEGFLAPEVDDDSSGVGYTMAVDLWSLGVLTACLLTGSSCIPKEDLSQLSQTQIADRFLGIDEHRHRLQWIKMSDKALSFLRRLLVLDPARRITASQALQHAWYKKPTEEAKLLEERYRRIIRFWRKRDEEEEVIKDLSGRVTAQPAEDRAGPRLRRKLPDVSLSPYFALDRHLNQRSQPTRRAILDSLQESGTQFVPSQDDKANASPPRQSKEPRRIVTVSAQDLFGTSEPAGSPTQSRTDYGDEVDLIPTENLPAGELKYEETSNTPQEEIQASVNQSSEARHRKRSRQESWDPEGRRIHSTISKHLAEYSSANKSKEEIARQKEVNSQGSTGVSISAGL
ncbi:kinase-like domain-containing protein [Halenospora varia]|nr:kinase-like domain-containing protein [Halenospora varia]